MDPSASLPLYHTVDEIRCLRKDTREKGQTLALIPTMGALHAGHLSLVELAKSKADQVVVSIFVNPTQFAPNEDLDNYPRTLSQDLHLLLPYAVHVFTPSASTMYPYPSTSIVLDPKRTQVLEGHIRPHFFQGVCTVVTKLLNLVQPDMVIFGQKDAQQCMVVRTLLSDLFIPTRMYVGVTQRESDGLAMSSRNRYLSKDHREIASILSKALFEAQSRFNKGEKQTITLISLVRSMLDSDQNILTEYIQIVSPNDFSSLNTIEEQGAVLCAAIRIGSTRLIDNVLLGSGSL